MSTDTEEQTTAVPEKGTDFEAEVLKILKEILWIVTQLLPPKRR